MSDSLSEPEPPPGTRVPFAREERILEVLGDPVALKLLLALDDGERGVHELVVATGLAQSSVYRKIQSLEESGFVKVARLAFTPEGKKVEVYRSLVKEVRIRVAGGAVRVEIDALGDGAARISRMWKQVREQRR